MKKFIKRLKKKVRKLKQNCNNYLFIAVNIMLSFLPLQNKRVLFFSDQRAELGGNLQFIYDSLNNNQYKKVVILRANTFKGYSLKEWVFLIYNLSISKYVFLDDWNKGSTLMRRRKNQQVVQLWHGSGAFKTFGFSRIDKQKGKYNKYAFHRNYTKAIVTSDSVRWCYAEGFGMDINDVIATGSPRTDPLLDVNYKTKIRDEFFEDYPEMIGKKIVLFAPTYRGKNLKNCYYDFEMLDSEMIEKELGEDYVFIIKWHPAIYDKIEIEELFYDYNKDSKIVYDFSDSRDINDLLIICDVLITDYSSVIFDYALLNKPLVYYVYDLNRYIKNRGFYFDFEDYMYGPCAFNLHQLIDYIKTAKVDNVELNRFKMQFMDACDGCSTEKTLSTVFGKNSETSNVVK